MMLPIKTMAHLELRKSGECVAEKTVGNYIGRLKDLYILQALWIYIPEKSFPGF